MPRSELALLAHLMRRAGFGATREELESYVAEGYETVVEGLLNPDAPAALGDEDLIRRYHADANDMPVKDTGQSYWLYRMINTKRPLEQVAVSGHPSAVSIFLPRRRRGNDDVSAVN